MFEREKALQKGSFIFAQERERERESLERERGGGEGLLEGGEGCSIERSYLRDKERREKKREREREIKRKGEELSKRGSLERKRVVWREKVVHLFEREKRKRERKERITNPAQSHKQEK